MDKRRENKLRGQKPRLLGIRKNFVRQVNTHQVKATGYWVKGDWCVPKVWGLMVKTCGDWARTRG